MKEDGLCFVMTFFRVVSPYHPPFLFLFQFFLSSCFSFFLLFLLIPTFSFPDPFFNSLSSVSFSSFSFFISSSFFAVMLLFLLLHLPRSRDSSVGIATGYGLDDRGVGVRVPVGSRIFSTPRLPDRLWGPPDLLSNGYRWLFPRGLSDRGVKLTTHFQLLPRSRKCGSIHPLPHTPSWRSA
jgi:hypothetical protein